jgi:predicted anti-sigma-YlaC factor YlaD
MSLIPNCKEVHRLTSEGMDRELSPVERARMRMHLLICDACRNFTGQMELLRRAMRQLSPFGGGDADDKQK